MVSFSFSSFCQRSTKIVAAVSLLAIVFANVTFVDQVQAQIDCLTRDPSPAEIKAATMDGSLQISMPNANAQVTVTNRTNCALNLVVPVYKFQPDGSQRLHSIATHRIEGNDTNRTIGSAIESCGKFQIDVFPKGIISEVIGNNPAETTSQAVWDANVLIGNIVEKGSCGGASTSSSSSSSSVNSGQIPCLTSDPTPAQVKQATVDGTLQITLPNANGVSFVTNRTLCAMNLVMPVYKFQPDGSQRLHSITTYRIEGNDTNRQISSAIDSCGATFQIDVFPKGTIPETIGSNPAEIPQSTWDANVLIGTVVNKGQCQTTSSSSSSSSSVTNGQIPCLTSDPTPAQVKQATINGTLQITLPNVSGVSYVTNRTLCAINLVMPIYKFQPDGSQRLHSISTHRIEGNDTNRQISSAIDSCGGTFQIDVFPKGTIPETIGSNPAEIPQSTWDANVLIGTVVNKGQCQTTSVSSSSTSSVSGGNTFLTISKSGPTVAQAGNTVTYSLTVTNNGSVAAVNTYVADVISKSAPVGFIAASSGCAYTPSLDTDLWRVYQCGPFTIQPGQSETRTFTYQINTNASCGSVIDDYGVSSANNASSVVSNPNMPYRTTVQCGTSSSSYSSSSSVQGNTSLTINKSGPTYANAGSSVTYSLTVTNNGNVPAVNTFVADVIGKNAPVDFNNVSLNGGCAYTPHLDTNLWRVYQCGPFTLQPGQSETRTFTYQILPYATCGSVIEDYGVTSANNAGSAVSNPNLPYRTNIQCNSSSSSYSSSSYSSSSGNGDVSISKTDDRSTASVGDRLSYRITVRNLNSFTLTNVRVTDSLPSTLTFISATYPGQLKGHSVRWDLTLAPYEVRELRVEAEVKSNAAGRSIRNIVRAKGERAEDTTSIDNNRYVDRRTNPYENDTVTSVNITEIEDYPTQQVYTIATLPRTGAGDRTGPLENTRKFLFPGSADGGSLPLMVWMSILSLGTAAGGIIGKRYFL